MITGSLRIVCIAHWRRLLNELILEGTTLRITHSLLQGVVVCEGTAPLISRILKALRGGRSVEDWDQGVQAERSFAVRFCLTDFSLGIYRVGERLFFLFYMLGWRRVAGKVKVKSSAVRQNQRRK